MGEKLSPWRQPFSHKTQSSRIALHPRQPHKPTLVEKGNFSRKRLSQSKLAPENEKRI
jgi:hypothetical protein